MSRGLIGEGISCLFKVGVVRVEYTGGREGGGEGSGWR